MYNQADLDKKERRRIIAAVTAIAAIVLILLVAIIVVATKKSTRTGISQEENTSFELAETSEAQTESTDTMGKEASNEEATDSQQEAAANDATIGAISTEKSSEGAAQSASSTTVAATEIDAMPSTGPVDYLPLAILAGMLTVYLSSAIMAHRQA